MSGSFDNGDIDLDAAEYVIGTLDAGERTSFAERLKTDASAQSAVAGWELRLAGLGGRVPGLPPPEDVWARIERALSQPTAKMHPFKVIDGGGSGQTAESPALRQSRDRWRMTALLTGAVAAALVAFLAKSSLQVPEVEPSATYVAAVNRGGDKPALIVRVDMKTGKVLVRPVAAVAPEGRSLELWYIGADKTPRSMGLVDKAPSDLALPAGSSSNAATFAVSVEPPGGSKTGGPTGPVVYSGQMIKE